MNKNASHGLVFLFMDPNMGIEPGRGRGTTVPRRGSLETDGFQNKKAGRFRPAILPFDFQNTFLKFLFKTPFAPHPG